MASLQASFELCRSVDLAFDEADAARGLDATNSQNDLQNAVLPGAILRPDGKYPSQKHLSSLVDARLADDLRREQQSGGCLCVALWAISS